VELGGSAKAAPGGYPVGAVGFGPCWEDQPTLRELYDIACAAIVSQEAETDELRAEVAMLKEQARILAEERDQARIQYRSTEALGMALVKTIDELKTEKADLFVQLVNLKAGSRRSTLDEIAESVREKYEPQHEGEGMDNE
jgi:cell division protein FtsB